MAKVDQGGFAGDIFLALAAQGRLVVDAERADQVIADLQLTLSRVNAAQSAPGQVQAMRELPKYLEAFRVARRSGPDSSG